MVSHGFPPGGNLIGRSSPATGSTDCGPFLLRQFQQESKVTGLSSPQLEHIQHSLKAFSALTKRAGNLFLFVFQRRAITTSCNSKLQPRVPLKNICTVGTVIPGWRSVVADPGLLSCPPYGTFKRLASALQCPCWEHFLL